MKSRIIIAAAFLLLVINQTWAQTSSFTYQGKLNDGGIGANGNYDFQFALFDSQTSGTQVGTTQTVSNVTVSGGVFSASLDFGASAFPGASRFLEISARPSGATSFTLLTPRQLITATPYAVRSLNAASADTAANAQQLAGFAASQYVKSDDARLSDARDPKAGNSSYVQNSTSQQAAANFNISGNGTAGGTLSGNLVNAATQYTLGGQPVLGVSSDVLKIGNNNHVGIGPTFKPGYQLEVEAPDKFGLRVGTITSGGTALSIGGAGAVEVDAPGVVGGRFVVKENGNVGIGNNNPGSKLQVAGTVESTVNGFKFPDGTVQASAASPSRAYTTSIDSEVEILKAHYAGDIITLTLPPGNYLITASVQFENRANDFLSDNQRTVSCWLHDNIAEFMGTNRMGAPGNPMDFLLMTMHTTLSHNGNGAIALQCGNSESSGKVFAKNRRLTAVRVAD